MDRQDIADLLLLGEGHAVTLVTPAGTPASWTSDTVEHDRFQARLIERGATIIASILVTGLGQGCAVLACAYSGITRVIPCDSFIPVTSRKPHDGLWSAYRTATSLALNASATQRRRA